MALLAALRPRFGVIQLPTASTGCTSLCGCLWAMLLIVLHTRGPCFPCRFLSPVQAINANTHRIAA